MFYKAIWEVFFNEDLIKVIEGVIDEEGNICLDVFLELMCICCQLGFK